MKFIEQLNNHFLSQNTILISKNHYVNCEFLVAGVFFKFCQKQSTFRVNKQIQKVFSKWVLQGKESNEEVIRK